MDWFQKVIFDDGHYVHTKIWLSLGDLHDSEASGSFCS
jgi:hypothetical protein